MIKQALSNWSPHDKEVIREASELATSGVLDYVKYLNISYIDITDIPSDQLQHLVQIVTDEVDIGKSQLDMLCVLQNIRCKVFGIWNMRLSGAECDQLLQCMINPVEVLWLYNVYLDNIDTLLQYDGAGVCRDVELWYGDTVSRYGDKVRRWAQQTRGWRVVRDDRYCLRVIRDS